MSVPSVLRALKSSEKTLPADREVGTRPEHRGTSSPSLTKQCKLKLH